MTEPEGLDHLWIVGPGRVGLALGLQLVRAGRVGRLRYTGRAPAPPAHPLFRDPAAATYTTSLEVPRPPPDAVLIAVPDEEIPRVAADLARQPLPPGLVVLHTSGALGSDVLLPLARLGCHTGSLHPLAAVSDPVAGAARLHGGWYAVEGDAEARRAAGRLAAVLEGRLLTVDPGAKPLYHAAAVIAANYVVALLSVAERWMTEAGVDEASARAALAELATGAVEGVARSGPVRALTGPISRGDAETVRGHLLRLSPSERALYSVLAGPTLELARRRGLDPGAVARLEHVLREAE